MPVRFHARPVGILFAELKRARDGLRAMFDSLRYGLGSPIAACILPSITRSQIISLREHRRPQNGKGEDGRSETERDHTHAPLLELP